MATFSTSHVFRSFVTDVMNNTSAEDLNADTFKAALYNTTPDHSIALDDTTAHNLLDGVGGQFASANRLTGGGATWGATGETIASATSSNVAGGILMFDGSDVAPGGTNTITAAYGCLVFDSTVSNHGLSMNYFGGSQTVTGGTFTIVWHANGIFRITSA